MEEHCLCSRLQRIVNTCASRIRIGSVVLGELVKVFHPVPLRQVFPYLIVYLLFGVLLTFPSIAW